MNIHLALRWILRSWINELTNTTIYNCFQKSTLISSPISLPTPVVPPGITELYQQVIEAGHIRDAMTISNFLNPADEEAIEEDSTRTVGEEELLQEVIPDHLDTQSIHNDDDDDEHPEQPVCSVSDALQALRILIGFTERQESLSTDSLRNLERLESGIEGIQKASLI